LKETFTQENEVSIKDILNQYCDMRQEINDKRVSIDRIEKQISKIEDEGEVIDSVVGGNGGTQHFKIKGFPYPEYSKKKTILRIRKARLEEMEMNLLEQTNLVEEYINNVDDSRLRRMLSFRFINDLTWIQLAHSMGGSHTEESCRKAVERFLNA